MKKFIFIFAIFMIIGLSGMAQIIQMQVQVYPQQVLANAPFKVFVSAYSTSGEPISFITATFNGLTLKASGSTASFDFIAPSITQAVQNFPVSIIAKSQSGETFSKESTITVSINANPVIQIGKPIPSNNSYIGNTKVVKVPVKVYGGLGLEKVEFMVDTTVASVINVSPAATVYLSRTFDVDTTHLKNGWHIFSVKAVNIAGEIFSSISAYVIDIGTPTVNFVNLQKCLPANTYIPVNVTAVSTISGIANVTVNGVRAELSKDSTWKATILTPDMTGPFKIEATAIDAATNKGYASFEAFSDGKAPSYLLITKDASMIKNNVLWGKYAIPSLTFVATTACRDSAPDVIVNGYVPSKNVISQYDGYNARILTFEFPSRGAYPIALKVVDPVNKLSTNLSTNVSVAYYPLNPEIKYAYYPKYIGPNSTMTVSVLATDGQGIGIENVFVNGVKAKEINGQWIADIKSPSPQVSGYHDFTVIAYDYFGQPSSPATFSYYVDVNPPYISITPVASIYYKGIYWSRSTFRVNINVRTDSGSPEITKVIVNQDPQVYKGKNFISIELTTAGTYTITVISTNTVNGFSKSESVTYRIKFDLKNPEITGINFPDFIGPSTPFAVKVSANDDFGPGIKDVIVNGTKASMIDSKTWVATLVSPNTSESKSFSIIATATDLLDLSSATEQHFFVDAKSPYVKITPVATLLKDGVYWSIGRSYIEIVATTDSKVTPQSFVTLNGKSFNMTSSSTKITIDKNGTYSVNVFSTNPVNKFSTNTSATFKFAFDNADPKITDISPNHNVIGPNMDLVVNVKVNDSWGPGVEHLYVNGSVAKHEGETWIATVTSENFEKSGDATLIAKAVDWLGRSSVGTKNYFVDTEPPVISVYLNGKKVSNGSEFYKFEKATPTISVKAVTDGKLSPDIETYINNEKVPNDLKFAGIGILNVKAVNPANGKVSTFESKIAIFVDPKSPQIEFYGPSTVNMTSYATFTLNINGKDLRYAILGITLNDHPLYFKIFDENGMYTISLRKIFAGIEGKDVNVELKAVDMAGNINSLKNTIYVDTVGPKITDVRIVNGNLEISFDKDIQGTPYVKLESLNGEVFDLGQATISSKTLIVKNVSVSYSPYTVIVNGITDNDGNPLMNNYSIWEF